MDDFLDELYGAPLEEFVATRNRLAREAAARGDSSAAGELRARRKPPVTVWAANQLARRHPEDVRALLEAGRQLRKFTETGEADSMRRASAERRRLVARLVERAADVLESAGRNASGGQLERVGRTLYNAAVDEAGRAGLDRGRLTSEVDTDQLGSLEAMAGLRPVEPEEPVDTKRAADLERLQRKAEEAEWEAERLERVAERAEAEARRARDVASAARDAADRARSRFERKLG